MDRGNGTVEFRCGDDAAAIGVQRTFKVSRAFQYDVHLCLIHRPENLALAAILLLDVIPIERLFLAARTDY